MDKSVFILLVCLLVLGNKGYCQHMPPYSLQPALEALHRRDAIALNTAPSLTGGRFPPQPQIDYNDEDVNEPNPSRNAKIDRLIAAYLAKDYLEDEDSDDGSYFLPEEKKKSYFRERDEKTDTLPYPSPVMSVFRERDVQPFSQSELADEFLREIEEEREVEREEKYKDALRSLWEKYQDQENEIFNEAEVKRTPPFMQKKRSYPVLPWLPYTDKRKRFPVAKRSPKVDKQSKDLEEIFGKPSEDKEKKKKRSVDMESIPSNTTGGPVDEAHHNHTEHGHHNHSDHKHHKRDDDQDESVESEEQEHEHDDYDEDSEEEEEATASGEEEDENRKKKRDTSVKMKVCQGHLCATNKNKGTGTGRSRQKKSIDWSQYFGLNRKKKSSRIEEELTPEKIDKMDKKLQLIEDAVLAETVKYTGAHPDISSLADVRRIKENVMSNLATAYSLEKMRQALNTLRQSIENENHLGKNQIEPFDAYDKKAKRLSVKKEKVDFEKNTHDIDIEPDKMKEHVHAGGNTMSTDEDDEEKRRKKRTRYQKYPILPNDIGNYPDELEGLNYEPLNDAYLGNKNYYQNPVGDCAIAENIDEKCKNIAVLSGAVNSELLTLCNVHQLCHLCSTTQVGCDFEYINEAKRVCGGNSNCLSSVSANMKMLRDSAGPQIGLKECFKIPCLYRLLKDINQR